MRLEHAFADLGGIAPDRLADGQALAGMLLAAANAAGLNPVTPPAVATGPRGVGVALLCHGGHITLHALPSEGRCFADVAGLDGADPRRGLDVIVKRLGARTVRTQTLDPERT